MSDSDSDSVHDELIANPAAGLSSGEEEEPPPPPPEPAAKQLYIMHGKNYYKIPSANIADSTVGVIRVYPDKKRVMVESGEQLGHLVSNTAGAWPKGDALCGKTYSLLQYFQIVVVRGKLSKEDETLSKAWYILFEIQDTISDDKYILRHIPKPVYKEIQKIMSNDPSMTNSGLNSIKADRDNEKPLSPSCNPEFIKVESASAPRSHCVMPERKKAEKESKEKDSKEKKEAPRKSVSSLWQKPGGEEPLGRSDEVPIEENIEQVAKSKVDNPMEKNTARPEKKTDPAKPANPADVAPDPGPSAEVSSSSKRKPDEKNGKLMYKKRKTSVIETYDVIFCHASAVVQLETPEGATGGKITVTWEFD